ncbi:MAG: dicarboxylate/amino acid:cation symporter [Caulobacteraceae bacterium]|nr:dicarboxylate/amino acid:cation symporter [Caulobacteraceae bacterium]
MTDDLTEAAPAEARKNPFRWWFAIPLWQRILVALVLGAIVGLVWGEGAVAIKWIGDIFVRLIRMIVAPLVFLIIASGVAQLGDARRLGSIGIKTIGMYVLTTFFAVLVGLTLATIFAPGIGANLANVAPQAVAEPKSPGELFIGIVPLNPINALASGDTLAIIFFAIVVGVAVIMTAEEGEPVARLLKSGSEVMLKIVAFVMEVAPFGVFALIAVVMGANGPATFVNVFKLAMCVLVGALVQTFLVHGGIVRLLAWLPLLPFYRGVADAIMVGFSTSSSSATLPVAIRVAEDNLGIKSSISSTVLPLGATIGMDGTAMYSGILTLFAAQAFGVDLSLADYALIAVTTTIVAMGAAPVPSGSLFVLAAVLAAINIGPTQTAIIVGFILPFDRILDMMRTVPNVTCDLSICTAVARWEKEIDVEEYKSRKDV